MSEFKVGQKWKRKDGKVVEIFAVRDYYLMVEDPSFPGQPETAWAYTLNGKFEAFLSREYDGFRDLEEQVFEKRIPLNKPGAVIKVSEEHLRQEAEDDYWKAQQRKATPVFTGFFKYFPGAIREVAKLSHVANEQHNPGQPVHWDKSKSTDHEDCLLRHLLDSIDNPVDDDGIHHDVKVAWRALAKLQTRLEERNEETLSD